MWIGKSTPLHNYKNKPVLLIYYYSFNKYFEFVFIFVFFVFIWVISTFVILYVFINN